MRRASLCRAAPLLAGLALACSSRLPVIQTFAPDTSQINTGSSVVLRWTTTDAASLSLDPRVGDVTGKGGAVTVTPAVTTTYTLTARNGAGSTTANTTVTVGPYLATLTAFAANPSQSTAGAPVMLTWSDSHAVSLVLSGVEYDGSSAAGTPIAANALPTLQPSDTQVVVQPRFTTLYTLTVTGLAGTTQPAPRSTSVLIVTAPGVVLSASSTAPPLGTAVTLSWTANGASNFRLLATAHGGAGPQTATNTGLQQSWLVRPLVATDYVVQALGAGGTTSSGTVTVAPAGSAGTSLSYTEPVPAPGDLVALEGGGVSGGVITLKLVALGDFQAGALALNLPLDGATAGSRDGSARVTLDASSAGDASPGFAVSGLNVGSGTVAAAAAIPGAGPLAGVLTLGAAQKPACTAPGLGCAGSAATDATFHAGTVIATVRLKLNPAGGTGPVFGAATGIARGADCTRGSGRCFAVRPGARTSAGPPGALAGTLAVGTLTAN